MLPHIGSRGIDLSCKQVVLLVPNPRPAFSFLVEAKTGWPLVLANGHLVMNKAHVMILMVGD